MNINITIPSVVVHVADPNADAKHRELLAKVNTLLAQVGGLMGKVGEINTKLDEIDASTNEIAADLDEVIGKLAGGVSAEEADALIARLAGHSETLKGIAAKVPESEAPAPEV